MKRISFLALLLLVVGVFYVMSCQKESNIPVKAVSQVEDSTDGIVTDRGPLILGTVSTYCTCSQGRTCSSWMATTTKRNGIKIVLDPLTHNYYNVQNGGLTYKIYNTNSCGNPGNLVANFVCNQATVLYANSNLPNTGSYSVVITYGNSSSGCYTVPAGTCGGQSCLADDQK